MKECDHIGMVHEGWCLCCDAEITTDSLLRDLTAANEKIARLTEIIEYTARNLEAKGMYTAAETLRQALKDEE